MEVIKITDENFNKVINKAIKVLESGGIVVYPTETCYGVGVDAQNNSAVKKVLRYKNRPQGKPISVAVVDRQMASEFVEISKTADNLYEKFLPGPVTVVSKSKGNTIKDIESEEGTLGIRIPDHPVPLAMVQGLNKPITSTSANLAGKANPYSVEQLLKDIPDSKKEMIDLIIDFGELPKNSPSTVVDTTLMDLNIIREGVLDLGAEVEKFEIDNESGLSLISDFILERYSKDEPNMILLNGAMGAGKTHLAKNLAEKLGIPERIKSPTYTVLHEYKFSESADKVFAHMDTWRLSREEDIKALRLEDYLEPGNILVVEWANKFIDYFMELSKSTNFHNITILILDNNKREFRILDR